MVELSSPPDDAWLLELPERAPTPEKASRLRAQAVEKILRKHRIRRLTAEQVLRKLKTSPLPAAPGVVEACSAHVLRLLPRLRLVHEQRQRSEKHLENLLGRVGVEETAEAEKREHRDVEILRSLPGVGRLVTATMLAEASQPLEERDYQALRSYAGVAPVTKSSGKRSKRSTVVMRRACNPRLRRAVYHWTRVSVQKDPYSKSLYAALRQRGHRHGRALRGVGDRLLRVLVSMLQHAPSTTRNDSVSPALLRQEGEHEPGATISPLDNGWEVRAPRGPSAPRPRPGAAPLDPGDPKR